MESVIAIVAFLIVCTLILTMVACVLWLIGNAALRAAAPAQRLISYTWFPEANPVGFELYATLLSHKFSYFRLLNDTEQRLFVSRLRYIRNNKKFVGRGMALTEEMEILVCASLTQLTFGLAQFHLEGLTQIHLTPESFYSELVRRKVKGLTFESGRVILSWRDFQEGYLVANDSINLGLHELAHSLWLHHSGTSSIIEHFDEWHVDALRELQKMRAGIGECFLREYAAANIEEFWACSVESFFEAPIEFRNTIPGLYQKTSVILNQDMAARYMQKANVPGQFV